MPGMDINPQAKSPVVVSAFHTTLVHQALVVGLVVVVGWVAWNLLRTMRYRRASATGALPAPRRSAAGPAEPVARRVLRIGFGALWIVDGLLLLQSAMPLGVPAGVLEPAESGSPVWVRDVVGFAVTTWSNHPVEAAAASVWITLGVGVLLLVAPRGRWSRLAGLATVGWSLVVWGFGEAFGGIFAPGSTWLFGTPGAAFFSCVAGALVALPESAWSTPRLGKIVLRAMGAFFVVMALLQAWPGRGFWQGAASRSGPGSLTAMVRQMAQTGQPAAVASAVRAFGRLDAAHGWAVNLVLVVLLLAIGVAFWVAEVQVVRPAIYVAGVLCLADWLFVQDLGVFGGVGTDPNSMLPMALVFFSGYLAVARVPVPVAVASHDSPRRDAGPEAEPGLVAGAATGPWWSRVPVDYLTGVMATIVAAAVVLVGAVPLVSASTDPNADPILTIAQNGAPNPVDVPAPAFDLVDQHGRPVSLSDLRGRAVALTFLDPVCTSDCPVIAQEFRQAGTLLGADSSRVEFVAVVANPIYRAIAFTDAFDREEGLESMPNWLFLTGSLGALERCWDDYSIEAGVAPAGAMVAHSELTYVIDARGRTREVLGSDPGNGPADASSFTVLLADELENVIHA